MTKEKLSAKDRLVSVSAAQLRRHGYHGVGLNDILVAECLATCVPSVRWTLR